MVHAFLQVVVTGACPGRKLQRAIGKFMPALPHKFGTTPPDVDPVLSFTALLGYGCDPAVAVDRQGIGEAAAVASQRGQQTRSQGRAGSWQAVENGCVRMRGEEFGNLLVVLVQERTQGRELSSQSL